MAADPHTLLVLNPGHFHAALTLRQSHPRLSDDVYVYAEDGPDVDKFLGMVRTFNERVRDPTHWALHVYRGADYLDRLRSERAGDVVIIAGKNAARMASIRVLHTDGFLVLGDKPWLIAADQIPMLQEITAAAPLAMDIMTERHEIATRVQHALVARPEVFGRLRTDGNAPAIDIRSVHHLYKVVNQRPLVRPHWYFDVAVQGEGISDVTTHLVDLTQWIVGAGKPFDYERDVELLSAHQWTTAVPRDMFARITGLQDFPEALHADVIDGALPYPCNARLSYRLRGVPIRLESLWHLAIPEGGGDTHYAIVRGTKADLVVDQGPGTDFRTDLTVHPVSGDTNYARALERAVTSLQDAFPGLGIEPSGSALRVAIPSALRTTHEEHFAAVLDQFLAYVDRGTWPDTLGPDLVTKYTLLARAAELSRRSGR
ncbi:MAG TPA: putative oxidoreductase C-terminal domain-containing protein [Burkholderiales bacterium]|nr:putative oxidoreductase C-terminal domain-containing protein [Burkholderiales bacterium]